MRKVLAAIFALAVTLPWLWAAGCSGASTGGFFNVDAGADGGMDAKNHVTTLGDTGSLKQTDSTVGGGGPCTGIQCQQTCASTTITGKVYDPAGENGLYNVYVYVPNGPLQPLASGPVCEECQAPASGDPITSTTTASDGTFTLTNVPVGTNIPVVLQLGKWRRHLTMPTIHACANNVAPDGFFRLPRKQAETSPDDNIPLIAFTTGCDGAECFFLGRVGIDPSEFTGPTGTGRVHVYKSQNDVGQTFPGGAGDAMTLWTTLSEWMKYDIVFDACECLPYNRGGAGSTDIGYVNFLQYLNAGGRAFTTHYFYNFFADETQCDGPGGGGGFLSSYCYGQAGLPTIGTWEGNTNQPFANDVPNCPMDTQLDDDDAGLGGSCLQIDTSVPKGVAFAQWYKENNSKLTFGGGEAYGYVGLTDIREDMGPLSQSIVTAGTATPWLYAGNLASGTYDAYYFSFNTPVAIPVAQQCGRAIFSDVHLDDSPEGEFPSYCPMNPDSNDHAPNELALEFLFFDLSSCVSNDTQPPPPPPPSK